MFYKFDFLDETIDFYNPSVFSIANPPFGVDFFANDARFLTQRFFHHLNATGDLFQLKYNVSVSHQKQTRTNENFRYNFQNQNEENIQKVKNIETDILYSTGTFTNFTNNKKYDFQLGYEFVNTQGFALVDGENQTKVEVRERLENYDVFAVSEINPTDRFSIRPGVRVSLQSYFDTQYASSLGLKYLFPNDYETRFSVGRSFRVPTFDELFSKIKFSGHQFFGNENLKPEQSMSYELSAKKRFTLQKKTLESRLSLAFLDVNDRIEMAFVGLEDNTPVYQFININSYQMWNLAWQQSLQVGKWSANAGAILVGVSQVIDDGEAVSDDRFLYNFNCNASLNYEMTRWNTLFSVYYKYNGVQQQFQRTAENGVATYRLSEIQGFSFMDASVRKSFANKKWEVTLGARNLLNVTRINQGFSGEAHSASTALVLGYGRSYFLKLLFNLNI